MRKWIILLFTVLFTFPVLAEKRPFTIEALYKIKNVRDPRFSPDGNKIAFTVTEYFLKKGKSNSDIYLMNTDGSGLMQLTESEAGDSHPRWSPDGKSLLFISDRKDGSQLWLLPVNGGEAKQLSDLSFEVSDPLWSPDGENILFVSEVFPECAADDESNKKINDGLENGIVQAHLADSLFYRHWNIWKDGRRFHTFVFNIKSKKTRELTHGEWDAPSFLTGGDNAGFDISPDGKELCVAANTDSNRWENTNKNLWLIPVSAGKPTNITADNKAFDGYPQYSPDGRYIAYLVQKIPHYESDLIRLAIYDRQNKTRTILTENFDNWVGDFQWAPDSRSIYFLASVKGHNPLYNVNIQNKKIRQVLDLKTIDDFKISPDGKSVVAARRAIAEPREIWIAGTNGKNIHRLTFFNKKIEDEVDIRPAEEMWIKSPDGAKIHTFVIKPHNFDPDKKYPLILNVHGGPQSQWMDSFRGDWQVYPGSGYVVAFPNPHGSTGYGQEFTHEISGDYGGLVYRDVMAVADSLENIPWIDKDRMGAMGWSFGGFMMMWLEGHTQRFKAIAAMMGVYDQTSFYGTTEELWFPRYDLGGEPWNSELYQKWSPSRFAKNFKTPCLVITGEKDFRVSYTQSLQFFTALQKMAVPSRLIVFKNDCHWPSYVKSMPLYYDAHLDWFHKYLGGNPAPYDVKKMVRNMLNSE